MFDYKDFTFITQSLFFFILGYVFKELYFTEHIFMVPVSSLQADFTV